MQTCLRFLVGYLLLASGLPALRPGLAAGGGVDPAKLQAIHSSVQRSVDDHTIAGAVTLVARHGRILDLSAVGLADIEQGAAMRTNSLFWIASMTKPITATAILMLQDEGKLTVDDPVEKHLAEFKNQWMIEAKTNDSLSLKRPPRSITIRDLLTHTSGIGDAPAPRQDCSLAELVAAYSKQPLQFPPGSRWSYSNAGINTLGRIVEIASGVPYAEFVQTRLLQPLGMKDTTFWPTPAQAALLAKSYQPKSAGTGLEQTDIFFLRGKLEDRRRTAFPAGGLFSTAQDYFHFCQMLLNGGAWEDKQLLSRGAAQTMTRTQTGDIQTGFTDGMSFGYGFGVVKRPAGVTAMLSPGSFGHGGAYGTQAWVDREKDTVLILMIQRAKLPNADASEVRRAFQEAAVEGVRD